MWLTWVHHEDREERQNVYMRNDHEHVCRVAVVVAVVVVVVVVVAVVVVGAVVVYARV
jgi:hypothetical protein